MRSLLLRLCCALLPALSFPSLAWACATCLCGDPTLQSSGVETPYAGRVRLSLTTRERSDVTGTGPGAETMHELRFDLGAAWSPTSWLALTLSLPVGHRWLDGGSGAIARGFGLGEIEVGARASIWSDRDRAPTHRVSLGLGLKLPTALLLRDAAGKLKPIDVQLGTGAVDPRVELVYAGRFGRLTALASTSAVFPIGGWMLLRPAPSWRAGGVLQLQPVNVVAFRAGVEASYEGVSVQAGAPDPVGSGLLGSVTAGVLLSPITDVVIDLGASVPVINRRVEAVVEPMFSLGVAVDVG